jgi:TolB protein
MDRDGTDLVRLTDHPGRDMWPTWSPNGARIAFMSDRDSADADTPKYDIYVMNADGSEQRRITFDEANDRWPAWSPDGSMIAFTSNRYSGLRRIWLMDPNGGNLYSLSEQNVGYDDFYPTWSPDGRITFVSNRPAPSDGSRDDEIYMMNANGSNVQQLTDNDAGDWLAHWSPDGTRFAFYTNRDHDKNIYVKTLATGEEMRITDTPSSEEYPAWSP